VRIRTDRGIEGHSFLGWSQKPGELDARGLVRYLKPILLGQDPLDRERLHQALWRRRAATIEAIGAIDIVLWDIAGKAANLPIYQLIGAYRTSVPAYVSSQVLASPAAYAEQAQEYKELGWTAYKLHPPQSWRTDIAACEAVRAAVGTGYTLMLDSIWSYSFEEALKVGRAIEALDFHWFEDPLGEHDIYGYARLREKLDVPIVATEHPEGGFDRYAAWIMAKATDYLRGDVALKGGITNLLKIAHLAEAFGMKCEIHHGGNSLNNFANLHVTLAIRNCDFFEILLPDAAQKYGLVEDITVDRAGLIHAPKAPGLGAEIDFAMIDRRKIGVLG
jgi:L-alanine-DL-glutamate epimerase-like enolase superfamily enzyme